MTAQFVTIKRVRDNENREIFMDKILNDFLQKGKKNFVFIGEAGSGKSEIAINFAVNLARIADRPVHFFDMDQTKPLFRSRDVKEKIEAENKEAFDIMVNIAYLMSKYELLDMVVKIDVSNPDKILAYVNKVEVNLGDMSNGDRKIRTMAEVIKNINENDRGSLDLSDLSKPIIFKYLT